jgi:hypothetical protein
MPYTPFIAFNKMFNMDKFNASAKAAIEDMKKNPNSANYSKQTFSQQQIINGETVENNYSEITDNNGKIQAKAKVFIPAIEGMSKEEIKQKIAQQLPEDIRANMADLEIPEIAEQQNAEFNVVIDRDGQETRVESTFSFDPAVNAIGYEQIQSDKLMGDIAGAQDSIAAGA